MCSLSSGNQVRGTVMLNTGSLYPSPDVNMTPTLQQQVCGMRIWLPYSPFHLSVSIVYEVLFCFLLAIYSLVTICVHWQDHANFSIYRNQMAVIYLPCCGCLIRIKLSRCCILSDNCQSKCNHLILIVSTANLHYPHRIPKEWTKLTN